MRRIIALVFALMMAALVLTACGKASEESEEKNEAVSADSLKTFGDIIALEKEEPQLAVGEGKAVYAFKAGGTYYRAIADLDKDVEEAFINIDILAEGYEEKQNEILGPIGIDKLENLSEQLLTEDQLASLSGKTGQELLDEGWTYQGSYDLESMEVLMTYGPFSYRVSFEGQVEGADQDDFDVEAATKGMKVRSAAFEMLADDATDVG